MTLSSYFYQFKNLLAGMEQRLTNRVGHSNSDKHCTFFNVKVVTWWASTDQTIHITQVKANFEISTDEHRVTFNSCFYILPMEQGLTNRVGHSNSDKQSTFRGALNVKVVTWWVSTYQTKHKSGLVLKWHLTNIGWLSILVSIYTNDFSNFQKPQQLLWDIWCVHGQFCTQMAVFVQWEVV